MPSAQRLLGLAALSAALLGPLQTHAAPPAAARCPPLPAAPAWSELVISTPEAAPLQVPPLRQADVVWREMIDGATRSIDWAVLYASERPGSRLQPVIEALIRAAGRKVKVRILADAEFRKTYPATLARLHAVEGVEVALLDAKACMGGVMHAKYFVVDGRRVYLGSQNFDWRSLQHIVELGLRLDDERVAGALLAVFETDWLLARGQKAGRAAAGAASGGPAPQGAAAVPCSTSVRVAAKARTTVRLLASPASHLPAGIDWELPALLETIGAATERLDLQLLTYGTKGYDGKRDRSLEQALIAAGARGVRVRVLLADWVQRARTTGSIKKLQRAPGVEVKLVTVPQHPGGFIPFARVIHAKYLLADKQTLWLGTSNWEPGYFHESRNGGLLLNDPSLSSQATQLFEALWACDWAVAVDPNRWYEAPRFRE